MNIWQKITLGVKFLFGGFESATDYILGILNGWLTQENIAANVMKVYNATITIGEFLDKYAKWCPPVWEKAYKNICGVIWDVAAALADGKIESNEIGLVVDTWKQVYTDWMSED